MVLQQVDLVDVEEAAIGARQQAGLEGLDAGRQRPLQIERTNDPILCGTQRQVDDRDRDRYTFGPCRLLSAVAAPRRRQVRVAVVAATGESLQRRQQGGESTHGR